MPTSITVAPGLTKSGVTKPGRPIAATRMSAVRADGRQVRGLRMADRDRRVAVQQQHRHRLADDLAAARRPRRACRAIGDARLDRASRSRPTACTARGCARPCTRRPTLTGVNPSTSLSGSIASNTLLRRALPHRRRQRRLHEDAVVRVAVVQATRRAPAARRARRSPAADAGPPTGPDSVPALTLLRT